MEIISARTERTYVKLVCWVSGIFVLIVLLSWGGCQLYNTTQEQRLVRRAAAYMSGGDLKAAGLTARRAAQINPESVAAARVMAEIGEKSGERNALDWRRKVVELQPESRADAIALANSALQFNEIKIAEKALASLDEASRQTAEYHAVAARLAEAQKAPAQARDSWVRAAQLEPQNQSFQLQLALARIATGVPADRTAGLEALEQLRASPEQRAAATRALILDGVTHGRNATEIHAFAEELQQYPEATFRDRMLFLELLRRQQHPAFVGFLTSAQTEAMTDPLHLGTLLGWMNGNAMSLVALDFVKTLPMELTGKWPVPFEIANAHARLSDWDAVERFTKSSTWGQYEFLRRAFLARALRATDKTVAAEREWTSATKEASGQAEALLSLARTVADWGWGEEIVDLLWTLTKFPGKQAEALTSLYGHYAKAKDTQGLYRVLLRLAEQTPGDLNVQNNLAQTSLLLNAEPERARKLAAEVYAKEPKNPSYLSTYAFSLYRAGNAAGAVEAMNALTEEQLQEPAISAYYGVFLAGTSDSERARKFLALGENAFLLPEERALLEQAVRRLDARRAFGGAQG